MGHESIATTNQYLHFLGSSADRAGLERLNQPARAMSTGNAAQEIERVAGHAVARWHLVTSLRFDTGNAKGPGQRPGPCGGAEGIRTPDLLIANETRYQLRHSPIASTY